MTELTMVETEIELARQSRVPVLITAPPDRALAIAEAIAAGSRRATPGMMVCDGAAIVSAARGGPENGTNDKGVALIVREVYALSDTEQDALMRLLDPGKAVRHRIIASSSVCLFDRVRRGTFNKTLFYRLNMIHIVGHSCSDRARTTAQCCSPGASGYSSGFGENLSPPS
jgi:hypothetical protein